jgi:hypothetical protein
MRDLKGIAALNQQLEERRRWRAVVEWFLVRRPQGSWGRVFGDMT